MLPPRPAALGLKRPAKPTALTDSAPDPGREQPANALKESALQAAAPAVKQASAPKLTPAPPKQPAPSKESPRIQGVAKDRRPERLQAAEVEAAVGAVVEDMAPAPLSSTEATSEKQPKKKLPPEQSPLTGGLGSSAPSGYSSAGPLPGSAHDATDKAHLIHQHKADHEAAQEKKKEPERGERTEKRAAQRAAHARTEPLVRRTALHRPCTAFHRGSAAGSCSAAAGGQRAGAGPAGGGKADDANWRSPCPDRPVSYEVRCVRKYTLGTIRKRRKRAGRIER